MNAATIDVTEVQGDENASNNRIDVAANLISTATKWSAVSALIPVPALDVVAVGAVQVKLVADIATLYGSSFSNESVKALVAACLGTLLPAGAANAVVGSSAKYLPGYGTAVGIVSMSAFSSAATYAIGKIFVRHFEGGGTLASFSPEAVKEDLKAEFKKASSK